jgi:hypothetical protein
MVEIDDVGTDRVRLDGITKKFRDYYKTTWFTDKGKQVGRDPKGYIAPPLDGVWASAPYLHNGSVPTLWAVLNVRQRPTLWKAVRDGDPKASYDLTNVGLALEPNIAAIPGDATSSERRRFYDTSIEGQSNVGHTYPDKRLSPTEKRAVLEYLKTL